MAFVQNTDLGRGQVESREVVRRHHGGGEVPLRNDSYQVGAWRREGANSGPVLQVEMTGLGDRLDMSEEGGASIHPGWPQPEHLELREAGGSTLVAARLNPEMLGSCPRARRSRQLDCKSRAVKRGLGLFGSPWHKLLRERVRTPRSHREENSGLVLGLEGL